MSDLVERLRSRDMGWSVSTGNIFDQAADEIERLEKENKELKEMLAKHKPGLTYKEPK